MFCSVFQAFSSESLALDACFLQFLQLPDFLRPLLISPRVCIPSFGKVPWSTYDVVTYNAQSCPALCGPMDCRLPGFSVYGISQAKYWSGLLCPSPGVLPNPGIKPMSPALQANILSRSHKGSPYPLVNFSNISSNNIRN